MTYGIPVQVLPMTLDGDILCDNHKLWLEERRHWEECRRSDNHQKELRCAIPGPKDVLFGRDKISRSHTGNIRYYHLIATRQEQYDSAVSKDEKFIIASDIVLKIKESGGRFFKLDKAGWVAVDDDTAREKVTSAFRTRRRSKMNARASSFEKQRSTGSEESGFKRKADG